MPLILYFSTLCMIFYVSQSCAPTEEQIHIGALEHFKRGNLYLQTQNYTKAIHEYNTAIQWDDTQETFFYNKGLAQYELRLYSKAIQSYQQALKRNERFSEAWYNMALAYYKLGDTENAFLAEEKYRKMRLKSK